jgi:hypothetical protein
LYFCCTKQIQKQTMKKIMTLVAIAGLAFATSTAFAGDGKACTKDSKSCCKSNSAKSCAKGGEAKSSQKEDAKAANAEKK